MTGPEDRRAFLQMGAAALGGLAAGAAVAQEGAQPPPEGQKEKPGEDRPPEKFRAFSRYQPSYGGAVGGDQYRGKLVPGLRNSGLAPVPVQAPDLGKVPWKVVDGVKEFHLTCEPVRRELLPGYWMNFYGYNGTMPGPTIEATQGDRVRFVVHNKLPEPTTVHWHGLELPVEEDGVPGMTQDPIMPGKTYVYEFDLHETGTFFYHAHDPMQEAFGMGGWFIIHPAVAWDPPVDRDFLLLFQNFEIRPAQTTPDSWGMGWNWHTINGRSGPYATPMVCKLGERVRVRILNFSVEQHHPIHFHGHTFWLTGREGARTPPSAWVPRNTELIGVAQATDFEFVANNPGDWMLHCHMVHHMMNHMTEQVGPRLRPGIDALDYKARIDNRPRVSLEPADPGFQVPGYRQNMTHGEMTEAETKKILGRREVQGMRHHFHMSLMGLMTAIRVLPEDLYRRVMETDEAIPHGAIFDEIVKRNKERGGK
jgi:FtsP/CotA-like multicopper oxidase with cupredoxin domain